MKITRFFRSCAWSVIALTVLGAGVCAFSSRLQRLLPEGYQQRYERELARSRVVPLQHSLEATEEVLSLGLTLHVSSTDDASVAGQLTGQPQNLVLVLLGSASSESGASTRISAALGACPPEAIQADQSLGIYDSRQDVAILSLQLSRTVCLPAQADSVFRIVQPQGRWLSSELDEIPFLESAQERLDYISPAGQQMSVYVLAAAHCETEEGPCSAAAGIQKISPTEKPGLRLHLKAGETAFVQFNADD